MSATKILSGYQAFMQTALRDKKTTFSDAVVGWKTLDDTGKSKWKETGASISAKLKGAPKPRKEVNKNFMKKEAPAPAPAPAPKKLPAAPEPKPARAKQVSTPAPVPKAAAAPLAKTAKKTAKLL